MGSVRGFCCQICRAELLATAELGGFAARTGGAPPVLCCGQPLRPLESDQILGGLLKGRHVACCPRCGYKVRVIIHPAGPLICMVCQTDFVIVGGTPHNEYQRITPLIPATDTPR
jgi:hypothetical protein